MKYLFLTLIVFTILSCETKIAKYNNPVKKTEIIDTTNSIATKSKIADELFSLLKKYQIISNNYPKSNIILLKSSKLNDSITFSSVHFPFDSTLQNLYESELVFNALILHRNDQIINYHVIDAVEEEDFNFLFSSEQYIIYEFYSSPVGYTIYYILNTKNKRLFKSEAIEEGYVIESSKINFEHKTLTASLNKKTKMYSLKKVW